MTRSRPPQVAFNSAEISPQLAQRFDYQRYQNGLARCRGFLPARQGLVTRAPGTWFRGFTKDNKFARRIEFEFAENDALKLEFTDYLMRVWRYGALVMDGSEPFELVTPYAEADLLNLTFVQSADVIYLADGTRPIQKLKRLALDDWEISDFTPDDGPFRIFNLDEDVKVQASAETGTGITLTATSAVFEAAHVGSIMQLEPEDLTSYPGWTGETNFATGDRVRYDGNTYELTSADGNVGPIPPQHLSGTRQVSKGVSWEFICSNFGTVRITAVASDTSATADVLAQLPNDVVAQGTYLWSEAAWSEKHGYPAILATTGQRLVAAATPTDPRTLWFTASGTTEVFEPGVEADDAFAYGIGGTNTINRIIWLADGSRGLYIGALGEELSTAATDGRISIGAATLEFRSGSNIGSRAVAPAILNGNPIFISKDATRLIEIEYSLQQDKNVPVELSLPANHFGAKGFAQVKLQYAPEPFLWVRCDDGDICVCLYDRSQDVLGWALIPIAGGYVEDIAVTPGENNGPDVVSLIVRRTLNGEVRRCVEEVALIFGLQPAVPALHTANHFFCAVRFEQDPAQASFSVPHLVGETVSAWTEKGEFGPYVVPADGSVTLDAAVTHATIGIFDETHEVEELPIVAATPEGHALGRLRSLGNDTGIAVYNTADGYVKTYAQDLGQPRRVSGPIDILPRQVASDLVEAYSGTVRLPAITGNAAQVGLIIGPRGGAPLTIAGMAPSVDEVGP